MRHTREAIDDAQAALDDATRRFLLERGWNYTSQTPGSYWMWHKQIPDGRDLLVTQDMALSVQDWLDDRTPTTQVSPNEDEPHMIVRRTFDLAKRLRVFYSWPDALLWLESPQKTLTHRRPIDLVLTEEGYSQISTVLAQLEDGAHI